MRTGGGTITTGERIAGTLSYLGPVSIIVYMYARSQFVSAHGRQGPSVFVLQVVGCLVICLFTGPGGLWVWAAMALYLILTVGLQVRLAVQAALGKAVKPGFVPG